MRDLTLIARQFHEDGFAIIRGLFSRAELADLERQLDDYVQRLVPTLGPGWVYYEDSPAREIKALHNLDQHSEYFRQVRADGRLLEIVKTIFPDGEVIPGGTSFFAKLAQVGSDTPPHQDNTFQFWVPPDALTATIAIDESTPDNGVLTCQRGSHHLGLLPHRQSGVLGFSRTLESAPSLAEYPAVALLMQPGDLALHHINTIHFSSPNRTSQPRRQMGIGYRSSRAKQDEVAYKQYLAAVEALHTEHGKSASGQ